MMRNILLSAAVVAASPAVRRDVAPDATWYKPAQTKINDLNSAVNSSGTYGFIYNSSITPDAEYGTYNWCNMPHVRRTEYKVPSKEYELQYVELIHRHHKRTPYSSNSFPVEPYSWNCPDSQLALYADNPAGPHPAHVWTQEFTSSVNPFTNSGWQGTCVFPQITGEGLSDAWQHGKDLYGVYRDLLGFLPDKNSDFSKVVRYRVTNNQITSQVAGEVINAMWGVTGPYPLLQESNGIDSLEPQYSCNAANNLFNNIESSNNPAWQAHLTASAPLYATLDAISGVNPTDGGFHASWDHYYDNLSARQCHGKPLPCQLVNGANTTNCVTQEEANAVYRMGNWEYSQIYRDSPQSLQAGGTSFGIWVGELSTHIRQFINGTGDGVKYFHNVAHDGSVSRLLAVLQIDTMVWPGMGSEVVFELYKLKGGKPPAPTPTAIAPNCDHDNCLRYMAQHTASLGSICKAYAVPSECQNAKRLSSACSCLATPTSTAAPTQTAASSSASGHYLRVLWGGQVLKSSHPALGVMDMVPIETVLAYFDALVGTNGSKTAGNCNQ